MLERHDLCRARVFYAILVLPLTGLLVSADPYAAERERMVREQIESRGIRGAELLRVLRATPRHLFVPIASRPMAYDDHAVPIGYGATISQPYIVALMTELLAPAKKHRVLEIGTGSGYQAAVLSQLAQQVYTIEIVPELAKSAQRILSDLGYRNVTVRQGDGYKGWPEQAPFDGIIVTAAPPEVPRALIGQLANGGRLVAPVGLGWNQELVLIEKDANGRLRRRSAGGVLFVPMRPGGA
ncbi:MAG TPA: protein-L-isoaspartate(D-aspartate) O-methyltransferase [Bryobacteraceae bacterium]|nr:protein-L-isoaspartate(D-aspartate) O-methyltransferase [Bryobacteraceae bacterium]